MNTLPQFEDLSLQPGSEILLVTDSKSHTAWPCLYVGYLPGAALMITANEEGQFPDLKEGQKVALKVALPQDIAIFTCSVIHMSDLPVFMVYLSFPGEIRAKQFRNAPRLKVEHPIMVSDMRERGSLTAPGLLLDISLTGARVELDKSLAQIDELINLKGKFLLFDKERNISLKGRVQNLVETNEDKVQYGLQFCDNPEEQLLKLMAFISCSQPNTVLQLVN